MPRPFQVGLTADFASGEVRLFDNASLEDLRKAGIECRFLERHEPVLASHQIQDLDALICLTPRVTADSSWQVWAASGGAAVWCRLRHRGC